MRKHTQCVAGEVRCPQSLLGHAPESGLGKRRPRDDVAQNRLQLNSLNFSDITEAEAALASLDNCTFIAC